MWFKNSLVRYLAQKCVALIRCAKNGPCLRSLHEKAGYGILACAYAKIGVVTYGMKKRRILAKKQSAYHADEKCANAAEKCVSVEKHRTLVLQHL